MPDEYYTHQYSGEEIDAAIGRAAAGGALDQRIATFVNPNLLINYDFRAGCLVNQRGQTEYTAAGYTVDRWNMGIDIGTVTVEDDGIVLTAGSSGLTLRQYQEAALLSELEGKTLTWSAMYTILAKTTTPGGIGTTSPSYVRRCTFSGDVGAKNVSFGTAVVPTGVKSVAWLYIPAGWKIKIHALKLELGDTQTLAHQDASGNWVLNEVPNYADTLRECQRYFQRRQSLSILTALGLGLAYRANALDIPVSTVTEMRASPTVVFAGSVGAYTSGAKAFSATNAAVLAGSPNWNGIVLRVTPDASMTVGAVYMTYLEAGYIDFSAEL